MKKLLIILLTFSLMVVAQESEFDEFDEFNTATKEESNPWTFAGFVELEEGDKVLSLQRFRIQSMRTTGVGNFYGKFDLFNDNVADYSKVDIRELRWQKKLNSNFDLSLGRQVSTWGVADMLFINDLFPKNWVANFQGRDMEMLKDPSNSLRLTGYFGKWTADLVYQPEYAPDTLPTGCKFKVFDPNSSSLVYSDAQCTKYRTLGSDGEEIKDPEVALQVKTKIKSHELAFYYYDGFYKAPTGLISGSPLTAYHPELTVIGISDEGQWGPGIFSFEAGYYDSKEDSDGSNYLIENSKAKFLFGYRQDLTASFSYGVQWYQEQMMDYEEYEQSVQTNNSAAYAYRKKERHNTLTLRLTYKAQQETLWFSFFTYQRPEDKDSFTKFEVSKKFTDNLKVTAGVNVFTGKDNYLDREFGMLRDNDNAFVRMNYSY